LEAVEPGSSGRFVLLPYVQAGIAVLERDQSGCAYATAGGGTAMMITGTWCIVASHHSGNRYRNKKQHEDATTGQSTAIPPLTNTRLDPALCATQRAAGYSIRIQDISHRIDPISSLLLAHAELLTAAAPEL
jgi:hypothetical protein